MRYLVIILAGLALLGVTVPSYANCITRCDKNTQTCITDCN